MGKKLGVALGAGAARGLAHIGVLKVLHAQKIYPDYLAGTSMGAVIGALYAAGYTPEEIERLASTAHWKDMIDFTLPKHGMLRGKKVEEQLRKLLQGKTFSQLSIPLQVVAYNLSKHRPVIFSQGDVAVAVRASLSIPAVFTPLRIGHDQYIDGGVANPTPFDVVRAMGAQVVLAVDLFEEQKWGAAPRARQFTFFQEMKQRFVQEELHELKNLMFPEGWPPFLRRLLMSLFDKLISPVRVLRILAGREIPPIMRTMHQATLILMNNLAQARLAGADVDVVVKPSCNHLHWSDFDRAPEFIKAGEQAMEKEVRKMKRLCKE